jgi:DNA polymerase-3 subunit epsilon
MPARPRLTAERRKRLLAPLPGSPGVYLFFGPAGELLYVGKSKNIRSRVRAHFTVPEERSLCAQIDRIETRLTAGELGALLLELRLIKELRPLYNIRSRERHRMVVALQGSAPRGYHTARLDAVDRITPDTFASYTAIFRSYAQGEETLASLARSHRLCPKLLGLERTQRHCFSYHLGHCGGACMGEESVEEYNRRFVAAFEERRIRLWPFRGSILIEERAEGRNEGEVFVVDNWCLLYSFTYALDACTLKLEGNHLFDYDAYRILCGYLFSDEHREAVRMVGRTELDELLRGVYRPSAPPLTLRQRALL